MFARRVLAQFFAGLIVLSIAAPSFAAGVDKDSCIPTLTLTCVLERAHSALGDPSIDDRNREDYLGDLARTAFLAGEAEAGARYFSELKAPGRYQIAAFFAAMLRAGKGEEADEIARRMGFDRNTGAPGVVMVLVEKGMADDLKSFKSQLPAGGWPKDEILAAEIEGDVRAGRVDAALAALKSVSAEQRELVLAKAVIQPLLQTHRLEEVKKTLPYLHDKARRRSFALWFAEEAGDAAVAHDLLPQVVADPKRSVVEGRRLAILLVGDGHEDAALALADRFPDQARILILSEIAWRTRDETLLVTMAKLIESTKEPGSFTTMRRPMVATLTRLGVVDPVGPLLAGATSDYDRDALRNEHALTLVDMGRMSDAMTVVYKMERPFNRAVTLAGMARRMKPAVPKP